MNYAPLRRYLAFIGGPVRVWPSAFAPEHCRLDKGTTFLGWQHSDPA